MNYLFFDTECANEFYNLAKMCSFGYVLTDEGLNVIEADDILMNPESEWDYRILRTILFYRKSEYEKKPNFEYHYERIAKLFENTIVIGHAIDNDIRILRDACDRYDLPQINIGKEYYDTQKLYAAYLNLGSKETSLAKIAEKLDIERQGEKHTSLQDARISMLVLNKIAAEMELSPKEMLEFCAKHEKKVQDNALKASSKNKLRDDENYPIFRMVLHNLKQEEGYEEILKDKKVAISLDYENTHFKETILLLQTICNLGGIYHTKASEADIFVRWRKEDKEDLREKYVDEAISKGSMIEKINIEDFMKLINFDNDRIEEFYKIQRQKALDENKHKNNKQTKMKRPRLSRAEALKLDKESRASGGDISFERDTFSFSDQLLDLLNSNNNH